MNNCFIVSNSNKSKVTGKEAVKLSSLKENKDVSNNFLSQFVTKKTKNITTYDFIPKINKKSQILDKKNHEQTVNQVFSRNLNRLSKHSTIN